MKKFWNWVKNEDTEERTLLLEGIIAEDSWFGDEVTPTAFKQELMQGNQPITVQIHSPGGDCIAAAQIYNMLMDYPSDVTVKIDGLAASAASVIAMAGTKVTMSPTSLMMIHNPSTMAFGESTDMQKAIQLLDEVKESIINAYEIKTGLARDELSRMMDGETWMNAHKAQELGFCDEIRGENPDSADDVPKSTQFGFSDFMFSQRTVALNLMNKLKASIPKEPEAQIEPTSPEAPVPSNRTSILSTDTRLENLRY